MKSVAVTFIVSGFTFLRDTPCGEYQGRRRLYKGSKGGCYYKHRDGTKVYADKSNCKC